MTNRPNRLHLVALLAAAFACGDLMAEGLPRYRLEVGQKIVYDTSSESATDKYRYENSGSWTFWVVDENADGSFHLVVQARNKRESIKIADDTRRELWDKAWLARFDLFTDGRYTYDDTLGLSIRPAAMFPQLPPDGGDLESGWDWEDAHFWTEYGVEPLTAEPVGGLLSLAIHRQALTDPIYERERTSKAKFDLTHGLVRVVESTVKSPSQDEKSLTSLRSVEIVPLENAQRIHRESDAYFDAVAEYEAACVAARDDIQTFEGRIALADDVLVDARATLTLAEFTSQLDEMVEVHPKRTNYHRSRAGRVSAILDKPAPDWTLLDLDGTTRTLAELRGKVVVLDFWYRRCTWCVRSMPQIKQIVDDLAGEPFVFLGMNTDKVLDDAHFVVDAMDLNYDSLQAKDTPKAYKVQAYPTMVIIDQEGVVRGVHVGYAPDLRETVVAEVRGLLVE